MYDYEVIISNTFMRPFSIGGYEVNISGELIKTDINGKSTSYPFSYRGSIEDEDLDNVYVDERKISFESDYIGYKDNDEAIKVVKDSLLKPMSSIYTDIDNLINESIK